MDPEVIRTLLISVPAAACVIVVVVLFLNHQTKLDIRLNKISDKCHETQLSLQESYTESLEKMMGRHADVHDKVIARLDRLVEKQTKIEGHLNKD